MKKGISIEQGKTLIASRIRKWLLPNHNSEQEWASEFANRRASLKRDFSDQWQHFQTNTWSGLDQPLERFSRKDNLFMLLSTGIHVHTDSIQIPAQLAWLNKREVIIGNIGFKSNNDLPEWQDILTISKHLSETCHEIFFLEPTIANIEHQYHAIWIKGVITHQGRSNEPRVDLVVTGIKKENNEKLYGKSGKTEGKKRRPTVYGQSELTEALDAKNIPLQIKSKKRNSFPTLTSPPHQIDSPWI